MVRRQMGLLDDAIRDHLELKRRRGADPGEVAREQNEALPNAPRVQAAPGGRYVPSAEVTPEAIAAASSRRADPVAARPGSLVEPLVESDRTHLDQDTAEFDMALLLNDSAEAPGDELPPARRIVAGPAPGSVGELRSTAGLQEEELEWDFPGADASDVAYPQADQASAGGNGGPTSRGDQLA